MSKDWTGNKKSTFATLGASNHVLHNRQEHDYYATEPRSIDDLMKVEDFNGTIWEPACGEGHLSVRLEEYGKDVVSTDLIDRGFGTGNFDFLNSRELLADNIITNPPYKYSEEFVRKSIELGADKTAMFLKLTFLEGQKRFRLFSEYPPKKVWVYSSRRKCAMNGDFDSVGSSAAAYAWFIWVKGYEGDTTIGWIL